MIVLDCTALIGYLGGGVDGRAAAQALDAVAGERWSCSPLALARVLAPAAAHSPEMLARVQHVLGELDIVEVDPTSHAAVILGRLAAECALPMEAIGTLQLALERDATVVTLDPGLRSVCEARELSVLPA